ncbi:GNAT family N-acetyltransferase [Mobilitalea sibirica]|uniref:GNAT family N-acetyltransferase n=1 Tax=Mobilitalea sibirica TaxID=1462919 RepID=A0A8J7KX99_9FIRM|nr:GNAT family N-acetyltransferase [Mobilitalea sibirica]MBH1941532.1 GNAT family N-acetyltransferase [Mobilitalea sibirica]
MIIAKATPASLDAVYEIVHTTIKNIYPNYYPTEVVDFFLNYHNTSKLEADINNGNVYVLSVDDIFVGTGSIIESNNIGRLYVKPEYQGMGYGKIIMNDLEEIVALNFDTAVIEASLPAYDFYLKHGYKPMEYHKYKVENNRILCYYIMKKNLKNNIDNEMGNA